MTDDWQIAPKLNAVPGLTELAVVVAGHELEVEYMQRRQHSPIRSIALMSFEAAGFGY